MLHWECMWTRLLLEQAATGMCRHPIHLLHLHSACRSCLPTRSQEGRDLFSALNLRDKSGERVFSWYKRGKRVALDVASALAFLHARKVMHFDVKVSGVRLGCQEGLAG